MQPHNLNIEYQQLPTIKLPLANKFYRAVNARGKASGGDIVWVARERANNVIIAVARLAPIKGFQLLTGVYVAPNYRHQGIASQLINKLIVPNQGCYSFVLTHLADFYINLGFEMVTNQQLPCELAQRFNAYQHQGRDIIAMIYR